MSKYVFTHRDARASELRELALMGAVSIAFAGCALARVTSLAVKAIRAARHTI